MKLNFLRKDEDNFAKRILTKEQLKKIEKAAFDFLDESFEDGKMPKGFIENVIEKLDTIEEVVIFCISWSDIVDEWKPRVFRNISKIENKEDALKLIEKAITIARKNGLSSPEFENDYEVLVLKLTSN
jgi:hypothetical protein